MTVQGGRLASIRRAPGGMGVPAPPHSPLSHASHNAIGQRLGPKGQKTRERILAGALTLLEREDESAITLTSVAREAAVGMTTLYLYFPDLGDLVLAALMRVMDDAGAAFADQLRTRWGDGELEARALDFTWAHYHFWRRHARLLYIRNRYADAGDDRFVQYRIRVSRPLIALLERQMDIAPGAAPCDAAFAMVVLTGLERTATVMVNPRPYAASVAADIGADVPERTIGNLIAAEAQLIALAVRHARATMA